MSESSCRNSKKEYRKKCRNIFFLKKVSRFLRFSQYFHKLFLQKYLPKFFFSKMLPNFFFAGFLSKVLLKFLRVLGNSLSGFTGWFFNSICLDLCEISTEIIKRSSQELSKGLLRVSSKISIGFFPIFLWLFLTRNFTRYPRRYSAKNSCKSPRKNSGSNF